MKTKQTVCTPGPWNLEVRVSEDDTKYAPARNATIYGADGNPVISMQGRIDDERGNADLLLITAAPDLLAALKGLVAITGGSNPVHVKARAAIAKAEGQEVAK